MLRTLKVSLLMWALMLVIALVLLSGCAAFTKEVAPRIADGVKRYCAEPLAERQLIRSQVNGLLDGNTIKVTCVGDPVAP